MFATSRLSTVQNASVACRIDQPVEDRDAAGDGERHEATSAMVQRIGVSATPMPSTNAPDASRPMGARRSSNPAELEAGRARAAAAGGRNSRS